MEKYLSHCLDSLLVPNIEKVEIFVINDGSNDKTSEIAHHYEASYPDSIRVIDKTNGNYGSCINRALKEVSAKYIKVLDADDSFEKANFCDFLDFLSSINADLVVNNYVWVDQEGNKTRDITFSNEIIYKKYDFEDVLSTLSQDSFQMHAVTYNAQVFKNLNYVQSEGVSYTDMEWMFTPMTNVKSVAFFGKSIYRYLVGRVGQTVDINVSRKSIDQTIYVVNNLLKLYQEHNNVSNYHKSYLESRLHHKISSIFRICLIKIKDSKIYTILYDFDRNLYNCCPSIYNQTNQETIGRIPFKYIKYWRSRFAKSKKMHFLDFANKLYSIFIK